MTIESEDSQDQAIDAESAESTDSPSDQTTPSPEADAAADAPTDSDETGPAAEEAEAPVAVEAKAEEPADEDAASEDAASEDGDDDAADDAAGDEEEDDVDREIRPEDLADEEGGDNEYDTFVGNAKPIEEAIDGEDDSEPAHFDWYILKVQSNREKSICAALQRRVSVAGLDEHFKEIIVPTEDVAEFKNGKRRVVKRKLYPGYIVANMALNDETWFLVRETSGIGDFTGAAGKPTPMMPEEVDRIVKAVRPDEEDEEQIKTAIPFKLNDRVRIKEGTFENFEGDVEGIDEANGRVTVTINIFGRSTPVQLEHWQIENV